MGIRCMMLTGDNRFVAKWWQTRSDLTSSLPRFCPTRNRQRSKRLQKRYNRSGWWVTGSTMAPALVQADVGIAIGAGTDVSGRECGYRPSCGAIPGMLPISSDFRKRRMQKWSRTSSGRRGTTPFAIPLAAGVLIGLMASSSRRRWERFPDERKHRDRCGQCKTPHIPVMACRGNWEFFFCRVILAVHSLQIISIRSEPFFSRRFVPGQK